jgi:hypothetical protein
VPRSIDVLEHRHHLVRDLLGDDAFLARGLS